MGLLGCMQCQSMDLREGRGALQGIKTIVEDVLHVDPEWHRLATLPGIQEGWAELKVKAASAISECQARPHWHCQQRPTCLPRM